ncbi:MAG: GNAT family N-acetyltransferase [Thermoanaerobaculia bacterium]|nr:GNAT family N-acetyltransferase [Thermoanaerobaculia bacterium]
MTITASQPSWMIRTLRVRDRDHALSLLDRQHELNIYLIARIHEGGLGRLSQLVGVFRESSLVAVASLTSNVAAATDPSLSPSDVEQVANLIAAELIERCTQLRAIISPSPVVEALWNRLEDHFQAPTVVRLHQPVYVLTSMKPDVGLDEVRLSRFDDLDLLVPACAAMHHEEIGIDPLARDAFGYQQRIRDLVKQNRSFVWIEQNEIVFKCEISAQTYDSAQLMGVWTAPRLRRRGYAIRGLSEVCGYIVSQGRSVTLFVNDFNHPARRLYEHLGFRQVGENRALIW